MPAVLPAHGIGLHGEGEVLVNAGVLPPDTLGVGIGALERPYAVDLTHPPLSGAQRLETNERGRPALAPGLLLESPASEMMRTGDYPWADGLRHPHAIDEVADGGGHLE